MSAASGPRPRVALVVGARPNFMKAGPVLAALEEGGLLEPLLVHTGQHYDERMSDLFFRDLGLPCPAVNLGVGSGSHARQTGEVMARFEEYLLALEPRPRAVVVVGDVNSTLACALVAAKAGILLAHVEAGLRSFDRSMPEEINRIATDQLADVLYVTEPSGIAHLEREGRGAAAVLVGNTMIDTLLRHRDRARRERDGLLRRLGVAAGAYAVVTLHRPGNVDEPAAFGRIVAAFEEVARRTPLVWPLHPRAVARAREFGLWERLSCAAGLIFSEPLGYLDFLGLLDGAALVLTDSGGIQEEAAVLKVPCVTLRDNTERPVTLVMGGNVLAGNDPERITAAARRMLETARPAIGTPALWDGGAGARIARDLERRLLPLPSRGARAGHGAAP